MNQRIFIFLLCLSILSAISLPAQVQKYQCLPCGYDCDKEIHDKPGICAHCQMELVPVASITFKSITPNELCAYLKAHPKTILLDVRTKEEFEGRADPNFGTLKNALNIPIQELEARLAALEKYKQKEILVFCSHSHRSPRASYLLTQHGFKKVTNMAGGMSVMPASDCVTGR